MESGSNVVHFAMYAPGDWEHLLSVSVDREDLHDSYFEWLQSAMTQMQKMKDAGIIVKRVVIDIEELLAWCSGRGVPCNGEARSLFTAKKAEEMDQAQQ